MKRNRVVADIDHRAAGRDSLFLMADLRIEAQAGDHRVKVRNLSSRGMMAEGTVRVTSGAGVEVNLRSLGWVSGRVAWIQDNRFGIAFLEDHAEVANPHPLGGRPHELRHVVRMGQRISGIRGHRLSDTGSHVAVSLQVFQCVASVSDRSHA